MSDKGLIEEMQAELFLKRGEGWFRVLSGSMSPIIETGDRILAKKVDEINLRDIVVFRSGSIFITHRIIKIIRKDGKDMLLQRGDAGGIAALIPPESVMGKVIAVEKKGKVIRLDYGIGKSKSIILGMVNQFSYWVSIRIPTSSHRNIFFRLARKIMRYLLRCVIQI